MVHGNLVVDHISTTRAPPSLYPLASTLLYIDIVAHYHEAVTTLALHSVPPCTNDLWPGVHFGAIGPFQE